MGALLSSLVTYTGQTQHHARAASPSPRLWLNGAAVKVIRQCRGLTQAELGELAGIGVQHVQHLEAGRRATSETTMARLADALSVRDDAIVINVDRVLAQLDAS